MWNRDRTKQGSAARRGGLLVHGCCSHGDKNNFQGTDDGKVNLKGPVGERRQCRGRP